MVNEAAEIKRRLSDKEWRLNNLYYIKDKDGNKVKFRLNWAQRALFDGLHEFNVILKARQLGFTTFVMIYMLDECLFKKYHSAGVIAHTREIAEDLFKNKVKFAYDNLPEWLRGEVSASQDSARRLEFRNGSSITVGTSLRSGTFQTLLVSEYGKISARYPEKAVEIKTGALNTVHIGQRIFVESTAEGNFGEFYELCQTAQRLDLEGNDLSALDPKFHFFPWYMEPAYQLDAEVNIDIKTAEYFDKLPVKLTREQKAWYIKKRDQQGDAMKREYPSTPEEAFEQSTEGAIYQKEMSLVRQQGQIGKVPYDHKAPVYTFWDLGKGGADYTAIIFFQQIGMSYRIIDYHESHNEGWGFYAKLLNSKPYVYREHVLPWDGATVTAGKSLSSAKADLTELGVRPIRCVPKTNDLWADIKGACRQTLPRCWFDVEKCAELIRHLDNYRREWDSNHSIWKEKPRHDASSHGCDAFRTFAMGYRERYMEFSDDGGAEHIAEVETNLFAL